MIETNLHSANVSSETIEPSEETNLLSYKVIDAAMEVHRHLGPGFLESIYEEALAIELGSRGIRFERQYPVSVLYKEHSVGDQRIDLLVDRALIVELKAVDILSPVHQAQVISYLKAMSLDLALIINFNNVILKDGIRRLVLSDWSRKTHANSFSTREKLFAESPR